MRYSNAEAFRGDLERRLEDRAEGDEWRLILARRAVAFDRLLARMVATVPGGWSLSGERALALRFPERPSKSWNMDIAWPGDRYESLDDVSSLVMAHEAGDFFEIGIEERGWGSGGRIAWRRFDAEVLLAGQHFSTISLTFDLRYAFVPTEFLLGESTLGFAGVPCVTVATVPLEIQAAEMLLSHISECANGLNPANLDNVRDLALVAAQSGVDADALGAVLRMLSEREDLELPQRIPDPFEGWPESMQRMAAKAGRPADFLPGYDGVIALFDPLLSGEVTEGTWDAARQSWQAPGSGDEGYVPPF